MPARILPSCRHDGPYLHALRSNLVLVSDPRRFRFMLKKTSGLACFLALTAATYAQTITGSMSGRLVDQQGGVVVNAVVTVTESSKKTVATARTSQTGDFTVPSLLPGTYTM